MVASRSKRKSKRRYIPAIVVGASVSVVVVTAFAIVRTFLGTNPGPPQLVVQHIQIIRPPPPPPDVPPPPPPPEEKVDVPEPEKQPAPTPSNDPPPEQPEGLDANGTAGSDAFGLVGRPGGRDLLGGGGGSVGKWWQNVVQSDLRNLFQDDPKLRKGAYSATFQVWYRNDGSVERYALVDSSGDNTRDKDKEVRKLLTEYTRASQAMPAGIPQPTTVRIATRG